MITINFEFDSEYGTFKDALVLPDNHGFTDAQLDEMKQSRFDNWIAVVSVSEESEYVHPLEPPPPIITEETTE